jgi:hypothetical protein
LVCAFWVETALRCCTGFLLCAAALAISVRANSSVTILCKILGRFIGVYYRAMKRWSILSMLTS